MFNRSSIIIISLCLILNSSCGQTTNIKSESKVAEHPYTNQLIHESSPYLLQHAHNPVSWYPWGEKALQKAKAENKMIVISVGYHACHWCHVMEKEGFEDAAVAQFRNNLSIINAND